MNPIFARALSLFLIVVITVPQSWATCGGGGGGGMGGVRAGGMGGEQQQVYNVPWRVLQPTDPPISSGLVLYWFPASQEEVMKSSLRASRPLSLYASQCVAMEISDTQSSAGKKFAADAKLPMAVMATPDGTLINKVEGKNGFLKVDDVEKLVETEMKKREQGLEDVINQAKEKSKSGDNPGAITLYRGVLDQKCLFPKKAREAAKALKKLGVNDAAEIAEPPIFAAPQSARIEKTMRESLNAEVSGNYSQAARLYAEAHRLDPADPTPLRYLGELYRHHTGEWDKSRKIFAQMLNMPADPMSRAVAMHGLGKMTIHDGDFSKGLSLLEQSVATYPLALAYRNLAVYWNSEGNSAKADGYVKQALALDPKDPYNLIFAAAFMAGNGQGDEALKIAHDNEALLPASYNLAAIYAQTGQREKAMSLLKRHFYEYERFQAVRAEEMMEARVDAVFATLRNDPAFVSLTSSADGKLDMPKATATPTMQ